MRRILKTCPVISLSSCTLIFHKHHALISLFYCSPCYHILACDYLIWPNPKVPSCLTVASPINSLGNFLTIEIFICPVSSRWYHGLSNLCLVAAELSKKGSGADDLLTWTVAELGECVSNLVVMIGMHVFARCIHQNSQITTFGGLCLKRPISAIYIKLQNDLLFIKYQYLQRGN